MLTLPVYTGKIAVQISDNTPLMRYLDVYGFGWGDTHMPACTHATVVSTDRVVTLRMSNKRLLHCYKCGCDACADPNCDVTAIITQETLMERGFNPQQWPSNESA
jgi:hypothetical protein